VSERKARSLKALAEEAFYRMHSGRALLLLGEALGLAPHLADLWSLRSRVYEGLHRYADALADAQASLARAHSTSRPLLPRLEARTPRSGTCFCSPHRYPISDMLGDNSHRIAGIFLAM
jgi:tetratricopeptide (TPR) repeat protein